MPADGSSPATFDVLTDITVMAIAREIAVDHFPLSEVLKRWNVSPIQWERISALPEFKTYLLQERATWAAATNTPARVRLKSAAMIEFYLPEASRRLHDPKEALNHKVALLTQIAKFAGMGDGNAEQGTAGPTDHVNIVINIGPQQAPVEISTHRTIDLTSEVIEEEAQMSDFDWEQEFGGEIPAVEFEDQDAA